MMLAELIYSKHHHLRCFCWNNVRPTEHTKTLPILENVLCIVILWLHIESQEPSVPKVPSVKLAKTNLF